MGTQQRYMAQYPDGLRNGTTTPQGSEGEQGYGGAPKRRKGAIKKVRCRNVEIFHFCALSFILVFFANFEIVLKTTVVVFFTGGRDPATSWTPASHSHPTTTSDASLLTAASG